MSVDFEASDNAEPGKRDPAGDDSYDDAPTRQGIDAEILKRRKDGRIMARASFVGMALFVAIFFTIASYFAWRFFHVYLDHLEIIGHQGKQPAPGLDGLLPFVVPMMPAFFFSLLGLVTLITCTRFITSYVNSTNDDSDDANLIERIARSIAGILREMKGGGS